MKGALHAYESHGVRSHRRYAVVTVVAGATALALTSGAAAATGPEATYLVLAPQGGSTAAAVARVLPGWRRQHMAPGVKVASVKVVNDTGFIYLAAAVCGFLWAADNGMKITNNSYFIEPWEFNCRNDPRQRPVRPAVPRALRYSASEGVLNAASAGNSNVDLQHKFIGSRFASTSGGGHSADQDEQPGNQDEPAMPNAEFSDACRHAPQDAARPARSGVPHVRTQGQVGVP